MPEHLIRLRGGWERLNAAGASGPTRVSLPLVAAPEPPKQARLARWFQPPPLDRPRESLWLRLDSVPGLISVSLNDREIARRPFPAFPLVLDLGGPLPPRNLVALDVEFPGPADAPGADFFPWGEVALLIRDTGPDHVD